MHLILYDGVCGLCNRLNRFVLPRDRRTIFRFAALQSNFGKTTLQRFGLNAEDLDTFFVVINYESKNATLLSKTSAALFVLKMLGGFWRLFIFMNVLPRRLLDWGYDLIARNRYRLFGRHESCMVPSAEYKSRFIET